MREKLSQRHWRIAAEQYGSGVFYEPKRIFTLPQAFGFVQTSGVVSLLEGNGQMPMHSHLAELKRRHKALERQIESEKHLPATDDLHILELKRKKLFLKDEIEKLLTRSGAPERTLH